MFADNEQCSKTVSHLSSRLPLSVSDSAGSSELPSVPRLPTRSSGAKRVPRQRALSRDAIADAALRIVDTEGLDALTMRAVGQALGTGAASLYAHVASKDELLELVIERVIGEVPDLPEPDA